MKADRSKEVQRVSPVKTRREYEALYQRSLEDSDDFWAEQAGRYLHWDRPWDFVHRFDPEAARFEWFGGGGLNASYNCLDRHLPALADKVAYYWEGDDPAESASVTYYELFRRVNRLAAVLRARGVGRGDRVVVYLPMIVELPVSLLACARIGAVHCVVHGGLSAESLAVRLRDCGAKAVITADGGRRAGRPYPLKEIVDEALSLTDGVETVLVLPHAGLDLRLEKPRDLWWSEAASSPGLPEYVTPLTMEAEEPLFLLHTSGSTGRPKGMVHTHGGYLLIAAMTTRLVFAL
ncbi:MAG: AMP-binding protein, partial [Thermodesulfobacteriota bacterium]